MPRREHFRSMTVVILFVLAVSLGAIIPGVSANNEDEVSSAPPKPSLTYPNLSTHLNHLADGHGSGQHSQRQGADQAPLYSGGSVAVTVHLNGHVTEVESFLEDNGSDIRNVGSDYIEAYVPVGLLGQLSNRPGVTQVSEIIPPQPAYGNITSQAVGLHQADTWQNAGLRGQGVKVGVIDLGFTGYSSLMGVELPESVVARCYTDVGVYSSSLDDCEAADEEPPEDTPSQCHDYVAGQLEGGEVHGTAVAEAVIDIAPDVTLYISQPFSRGDLQETAAWMAEEGVTIINYSVGWIFDGPGDGTSPLSVSPLNTVDQAVDHGITWVNSAGNSAGDTWLGSFSDHDGDDIISFTSSGAEINPINLRECRSYLFQLRWEDSWDAAATDMDIYLWDKSTGAILDIPAGWGYVGSIVEQSGESGDIPYERFSLRSPINSTDVGVIIVHESGPAPDWIHLDLFSGPGGLGYSNNGSITNPAESANPGLLAVGAAPYFNTNTVEFFSSRGPTPDGRIKPDIVGIDCAASVSYEEFDFRGNACWFPGTSQASPHVAGMAALVKQQKPRLSPRQIASYLKNNARDQGSPGKDNVWGSGLAQMPALTESELCLEALTGDGVTDGQWAAGCHSGITDRGFARYYSFTLEEDTDVTIDLESSLDTYLYLRQGGTQSGSPLHENDDYGDSIGRSRIQESLAAGSYTIEATTLGDGQAGNFMLTISGLGGGDPGSGDPVAVDPVTDEPTPDTCGESITADGVTSGMWASDCQSRVTDRGYTRYYGFTLEQGTEITIDLESSLDTYLYLRRGEARTGGILYENDDYEGSTSRSRIQETLAAGSYTIEATTFSAGEAGNFTLTISGLGGGDPGSRDTGADPGTGDSGTGTPAADHCGESINADGVTSGTWASDCQSRLTDRGYARYYGFTLDQSTEVTIDLESTLDTYLYLRRGESRTGGFLYENDDYEGNTSRSRIQETLAAGSYTIEATTFSAGETGNFTLTVSGLGGSDPGTGDTGTGDPGTGDPVSGEPTPDTCGEAITADGVTSAMWASDCQSRVSDRGYARYYGFTLDQRAEVTVTLESEVADTYLYLRRGEVRMGAFLYENDDYEGSIKRSQIQESLAAGSYTIEATTFGAGETGNFTLTISGLGGEDPESGDAGTGDPETGTPAPDSCGETVTTDGVISGTWASDCQSRVSDRGYARYYGFTLVQGTEVTVTLESDIADTYLYLRRGEARTGGFLYENDDHEGSIRRSHIQETMAAGNYTIEATTFSTGEMGDFTLTITFGNNDEATQASNGARALSSGGVVLSNVKGHAGSTVTVYAENFSPFVQLESVRVGSAQILSATEARTDGDGNLSFEVEIPSSKLGKQPIEITVGKTVATVPFTVTYPEVSPSEVVEVRRGLESLGGNLASVWHFDNGTKVWAFFTPILAEGNTLTHLVTGETYFIRIRSNIEVTLNKGTSSLTCVGANCWNQVVW